jgi:hypothetical protein
MEATTNAVEDCLVQYLDFKINLHLETSFFDL